MRGLGVVVGVGILIVTFQNVDLDALGTTFAQIGPRLWLVPIPFALAQMTETLAWKTAFRTTLLNLDYFRLLRIRLACEGVTATCPGGMLIAESIKPGLLMKQFGLTLEQAVTGTVTRKLLLLVAQCGYFGIATLFGIPALVSLARTTSRGWWLSAATGLALIALIVAAIVASRSLSRGGVCDWLRRLFSRVPIAALRQALDRKRTSFTRTDSRIAAFCTAGPKRLAKPTLIYLAAWMFEALETFTILRLLCVHLDWKTIVLIEVCASMVRNLAFLSPSGLGAQDLSYAGLLQLFNVPDAISVAAAFVLLKRGKELLWSLAGYGLLAGLNDRNTPTRRIAAITESRSRLAPPDADPSGFPV